MISGPLGIRIWDAFPRDADDRPTFSVARFDEATFETDAVFERATFKDDACFVGVTFKGDAVFDRATFESFIGSSHNGVFTRASFEGAAVFDEATFEGDAWFVKATFKGNATFDRATFKRDAMFTQVTFEGDVPVLGPIAVRGLDLNGVRFASPVRIETDANILKCRRGRFSGGVRFDVRRASIRLDDSDLSVPSLLTGPAVTAPPGPGKKYSQSCSHFKRANVAGLALGNVDLADCRFAGAHNLDKLRLEAGAVFALSPARAGWERRQVIAEEAEWRANRARPGRWTGPQWPASDDQTAAAEPGSNRWAVPGAAKEPRGRQG